MDNCIVSRVLRDTPLYLVAFHATAPEFHWSRDRSEAVRLTSGAALDVAKRAYEFDPTADVPVVIDPQGAVILTARGYASKAEARRACAMAEARLRGVREAPATYDAKKTLANALVSLNRRISEGRDYANAHESACAQWGLTVAEGERLTAMYDAMCAEGRS